VTLQSDDSQRVMTAQGALPMFEAEAKERQRASGGTRAKTGWRTDTPTGRPHRAVDDAAAATGVGSAIVARAKRIVKERSTRDRLDPAVRIQQGGRPQRATALRTQYQAEAKAREKSGKKLDPRAHVPEGRAREALGKRFGVSGRSVNYAMKVDSRRAMTPLAAA
jgi:hypothetical protein